MGESIMFRQTETATGTAGEEIVIKGRPDSPSIRWTRFGVRNVDGKIDRLELWIRGRGQEYYVDTLSFNSTLRGDGVSVSILARGDFDVVAKLYEPSSGARIELHAFGETVEASEAAP